MASNEEIEQQLALLTMYRRTLSLYLQQRAKLGSAFMPPGVAHGIAEARADIARVKGILRGWGVTVDNHPDDDERGYFPASPPPEPRPAPRPSPPLVVAATAGQVAVRLVRERGAWSIQAENVGDQELTHITISLRPPASVFVAEPTVKLARLRARAPSDARPFSVHGPPATAVVPFSVAYRVNGVERPERHEGALTIAFGGGAQS